MPKISFNIWALVARPTGTCCPALVLWMPAWWAVDAHATGMVGPTSGLTFPDFSMTFPDFSRHFFTL